MNATVTGEPVRTRMRFAEFVAFIAQLMAITALSIDIMLPALPDMAEALGAADANDRQTVLTSYLLGFAVGQLFYGPLSDRFGRKPILLVGLLIGGVATVVCSQAPNFEWLLLARMVQGFGCAAPRVIAIAVVRDCFSGREMAKVMSLVMTIFIIVPIFAPAIGEVLTRAGDWTWNFHAILAIIVILIAWSAMRLDETSAPEDRLPLSVSGIVGAIRHTVGTRVTVGYAAAIGLIFGCLFAYLSSAQQIFVDLYGLGRMFAAAFAGIAGVMAIAAFANSRLVGRLGMRLVSHIALVGFTVMSALLSLLAVFMEPPMLLFSALLSATMFLFGLIMPNFHAMAMEPQGHIAGTASSFIGAFTTAFAAMLGWAIGQAFDGTVLPLSLGYFVLSGLALAVVYWTEGFRLFVARHE